MDVLHWNSPIGEARKAAEVMTDPATQKYAKSIPQASDVALGVDEKILSLINMERVSPRNAVRILRILYPIWMAFRMFIVYFLHVVARKYPAKQPAKSWPNNFAFRAGIVGGLITQLILFCSAFIQAIWITSKNLSLLMVVLALVGVPIAMLNELNNVAALLLLKNPDQMMFFLNVHAQGVVCFHILGFMAFSAWIVNL